MGKKRGNSKGSYFNRSDLAGFLFIGFVLLVGAFIGLNEVNNQLVDGDDDKYSDILKGRLFQFFGSDVGDIGDEFEITECVDNGDCEEYELCFENKCLSEEGDQCFNDDDCMPATICEDNRCIEGCRTDDDCRKLDSSMICEDDICQIGCRDDVFCPDHLPYCYKSFEETHDYCHQCRDDSDCPIDGDEPYCVRAQCAECKNDDDCDPDKYCEVEFGFCNEYRVGRAAI